MFPDLISSLQVQFGFTSFRPGQAEAVQNLLNGQHTLVVMPTGSGKSLVYQMAAVHLPGLTLVISPLIALMKDQVDSLVRSGISATFINSTLTGSEQSHRLQNLASGKYRLVYIAPERLRNTRFLNALRHQKLSLLTVDEAHCISGWGHDFRPDYLHIAQFRSVLGNPLTVALTATATPKVQSDIAQLLGLSNVQCVVTGFNRPNLALEVCYMRDLKTRLITVRDLLSNWKDGSAIVYTGTRRDAEEIGEFVRTELRINAQHYHAGLPVEERTRIQDAFMAGDLSVVVATNAFGMGIDRSDVRLVIHYSLPGSLEAYYQEAGRAGRDKQPARAVLLYAPEDRTLQEWFIENSAITVEELRKLFEALRSANTKPQFITTDGLSYLTGLQEVKIRIGLAELERSGALEHLGDVGLKMLVKLLEWKAPEIQAVSERLKQHKAHRTAQLERMIAYAESNTCRRKIILNHFGDMGLAEAEVCCDNCQAHTSTILSPIELRPLTQSEQVALIVLDTVCRLPRAVGVEKITQILKGSKAKDIMQFGYDKNSHYGSLAVFSSTELKQIIDQLIEMKYLKVVGGIYPVLRLTNQGEAVKQNKTGIPLKLPLQVTRQTIENKKAEHKVDGTLEYTAQLLFEGLSVEEIAAQRGLSLMTIYNHAAKLIIAGRVTVEMVVQKDVQLKIETAIIQAGTVEYLYPIKILLPYEIDYYIIRCVVEGWKRGQKLMLNQMPGEKSKKTFKGDAHQSDIIINVIIDCVRDIPGKLPRSGVAKLLAGSKSERVKELRSHPFFNRLAGHSRSEILDYIDQLLSNGQLAQNENGHLVVGNGDMTSILPKSPSIKVIQHIVALGNTRSLTAVPELIIHLQSGNANARRLAASALGKIANKLATKPLMDLLSHETKPQVRQYAVNALGSIGDDSAKSLLESIAQDPLEKEYTRESARNSLKRLLSTKKSGILPSDIVQPQQNYPPHDPVTAFLSRPHPRQLPGPWDAGWSLDFHSQFTGADWKRSATGELTYRLKYQNDLSVLPTLVDQASSLIARYPEIAQVDAIVPVPPSVHRLNDPVYIFAKALAQRIGLPFLPVVIKSRQTAPQKELHTLAQKQVNVSGAFDLQSPIKGKHLLVVDDLYDSGATLEEIYRLLHRSGAVRVCILTLSRTIHSDS